MLITFHPKVTWLLIGHSEERVRMHYLDESWSMPVIGERPPYYSNPQYKPYFPLI
ncbi:MULTISPECIES: hypothetical protein [Virgibacillus]|uniref:Uncharacterized protein n=1 Tax=Virgibacillus kapii TaxID=1638645 RepID=A0ABQ2DEF6_9BACI|nr:MULTISPECIES: hypothetical protein [Virgibacillus]EQB38236.1 hypothetical protein M948_06570 [Virgibacillus sp. CM-4]GGJ53010.1 hypothetical protein GCM10007111_14010 [Virgibacillus kapii]